jgi:ABC-type glycerol-3-phosphate transport system permease component
MVATSAAFAISRLRVRGGRWVMNAALFTYFIPAAFATRTHSSASVCGSRVSWLQ